MKDVRAPGVTKPLIVKVAPYITTTITDGVDAAFRPPIKSPSTCYSRLEKKLKIVSEREKYNEGLGTHSLFKTELKCVINFLRVP